MLNRRDLLKSGVGAAISGPIILRNESFKAQADKRDIHEYIVSDSQFIGSVERYPDEWMTILQDQIDSRNAQPFKQYDRGELLCVDITMMFDGDGENPVILRRARMVVSFVIANDEEKAEKPIRMWLLPLGDKS